MIKGYQGKQASLTVEEENGKVSLYVGNPKTGERKHIGYLNARWAKAIFLTTIEDLMFSEAMGRAEKVR